MHIKNNIDYVGMIRKIKECTGDVYYETKDDKIALKSVLSMYLFISILNNPTITKGAEIICDNETDYSILADYLEY